MVGFETEIVVMLIGGPAKAILLRGVDEKRVFDRSGRPRHFGVELMYEFTNWIYCKHWPSDSFEG